MSRGWRGGSTRRWREIRPVVLGRDGYRCGLALPGSWRTRTGKVAHCLGVADCVHHLHGKGRCAGCAADQLDHLQAACTPCNLKIGDPGRTVARSPEPRPMTRW